MRKNERKKIFQMYLEALIYEGGDNNIVIFSEISTKKFIQAAGTKGDRLVIIDLPKISLDSLERKNLTRIFVLFEEMEQAYQGQATPEQGSLILEKIFREVYLLPDNYSLETELNLS
ncbi:MAG: hypothetical protein ACXABU_03260 [Candidatus Hodarchaeales archaeon]|jgi:hypothetical protein